MEIESFSFRGIKGESPPESFNLEKIMKPKYFSDGCLADFAKDDSLQQIHRENFLFAIEEIC